MRGEGRHLAEAQDEGLRDVPGGVFLGFRV